MLEDTWIHREPECNVYFLRENFTVSKISLVYILRTCIAFHAHFLSISSVRARIYLQPRSSRCNPLVVKMDVLVKTSKDKNYGLTVGEERIKYKMNEIFYNVVVRKFKKFRWLHTPHSFSYILI